MKTKQGLLASQCGYGHLPLRVLKSNAGWYIGTYDEGIGPISKESSGYFRTETEAQAALDSNSWVQRQHP